MARLSACVLLCVCVIRVIRIHFLVSLRMGAMSPLPYWAPVLRDWASGTPSMLPSGRALEYRSARAQVHMPVYKYTGDAYTGTVGYGKRDPDENTTGVGFRQTGRRQTSRGRIFPTRNVSSGASNTHWSPSVGRWTVINERLVGYEGYTILPQGQELN